MRLVNRVITRDASKMRVGQVFYTPWCDDYGKVIDDGTVTRTGEHEFRWTAADPNLRWFSENASGLNVEHRRHLGKRGRAGAARPHLAPAAAAGL